LLADASFQISPGDKAGLVGRNGAGRTTLARILFPAALLVVSRLVAFA
jgi:ATPase subunit of ABC transporter with duplicated ATPase domains